MARRRTKKRTHVGARNGPSTSSSTSASMNRSPKSMVIRVGAGEVGPSVSQLVKDVRSMMEPDTASRLKERKSNKLRDYTTMAGPLGVSHLMLFSRSTSGNTNMRLALTPRGPTLHFRVEKYSLCKDVKKALKHPKGGGKEYLKPPLLVMNNFTSPPATDSGAKPPVPKHLESLTTSVFQSLFPPISPQTTPLPSIRRVLLLNRDPPSSSSSTNNASEDAYTINLRHYAITTRRTNLSRRIRRLQPTSTLSHQAQAKPKAKAAKGALPNLSHLPDISDYLLSQQDGAYTSASETEPDDTDAEVEVLDVSARKILHRKKLAQTATSQQAEGPAAAAAAATAGTGTAAQPATEKRAIHLHELGPRLKLRLTKVEEGVCGGKVLWNAFVAKSEAEVAALNEKWEVRNREREERRRVQRERVEEKKKKMAGKRGGGGGGEGDEEDEGMDVDGDGDGDRNDEDLDDEEDWDSEGFEDDDGEDEEA
ncbi:MAG: hypothetical protein M1819_004796 [Sarea resinae]|nr:MAG: hypothetical protein M1819_004796 [Sarea resinae]